MMIATLSQRTAANHDNDDTLPAIAGLHCTLNCRCYSGWRMGNKKGSELNR